MFGVAAHGTAAAPAPEAAALPDYVSLSAANPEVQAYLAEIDAREARAIAHLKAPQIFGDLLASLGEAIFYDRHLSAGENQACAFCHAPRAGFRGGIGAFNAAGPAYPGSVRSRFGFRVPQSLAYAAFAPKLHRDAATGRFEGGNFWDGRATGAKTSSPAAEQAREPLTNPFEMALPDAACALYRIKSAPYAGLFIQFWGEASLNMSFPADSATVCREPAGGTAPKLALSAPARAQAEIALGQLASTIVAFEASLHASPFSAKFDAVMAGMAAFTPKEEEGWALFRGRGQCAACHEAGGNRPLFTGFGYARLSLRPSPPSEFAQETRPDRFSYIANPKGAGFADQGLGAVLAASPDPAWRAAAGAYDQAFAIPTLRNVARLEAAGIAARYMHDGSFTRLSDVIHALNQTGLMGQTARQFGLRAGPLGLSESEEQALLAFLQTLNDGAYHPGLAPGARAPDPT